MSREYRNQAAKQYAISTRSSKPWYERWKFFLLLTAYLAYLVFYFIFGRRIGHGIVMISVLPVVVTGLFYGFRASLISGVSFFVIETTLFLFQRAENRPLGNQDLGVLFGALEVILIGGLVGYMSTLRKSLSIELNRRKQTEKELLQQKDHCEEILDLQPDLICRFNSNLRIKFINRAACEFFRLSEDEFIGKDISAFLPMIERPYIHNYIQQFRTGQEKIQQEFLVLPLYDSQDEKHYFQWSLMQIEPSDETGEIEYQAVGRNISAQFQAKTAERENLAIADSLKTIASVLNSTLDIQDVLGRVLKNIGRVVPHDAANIMLAEDGYAKIVHLSGYEKFSDHVEEYHQIRFPLSLTNLAKMANDHRALLIPDIDQYPSWVDLELNHWIKSYLGAPLIFKDELIGFLNLDSTKKYFFNEKHAVWLQAFADQAAIAIKNAKFYEEARVRTYQLTKLNEIMRASIHSKSIDEVVEASACIFHDVFQNSTFQIFLWEEEYGVFQMLPSLTVNAGNEPIPQERLLISPSYAFKQISEGEILCSYNLQPQDMGHLVQPLEQNPAVFVLIPLTVDNRNLGIIQLTFDQEQNFQKPELNLMQQFAYQISLAISKIQFMLMESERTQELSRTNELLEVFSQVSNEIEMKMELPDFFQTLSRELCKHQMESMLALFQGDHKLQIAYSSLLNEKCDRPEEVKEKDKEYLQSFLNEDPLTQQVIQSKQPYFYADAKSFFDGFLKAIKADGKHSTASLPSPLEKAQGFMLPLVNNDNVIGILSIWSDYLQSSDCSSVSLFSDQIANAIEKSKLYLEISQLAITDPLTGFYNRRGLEELGNHEIERSIQFFSNLSAIMIDIDHFKLINDRFGHSAGDQMLVELARCIRANLRDSDIICRYGGEEFFVLLPEASGLAASKIAERLKNFIAAQDFLPCIGPINATISIGISQLSEKIRTLDDMIKCADLAMYQAKESGRNQIRHYNH